MIIAIYARVSTGPQELEAQLSKLQEFTSKKYPDANKVLIYQEKISGTKESRKAFDRLFDDAHKLLFDHLIFYDLSRFGRTSVQFTFQKLWELDNLKITWESYYEPYLATMGIFKEAMISILSAVNKLQRDITSQKTIEKLAYKKDQGIKLGRPAGSKDKKKRKKKNYFDNQNASKKQKKGGSEITSESI